MTLKINNKQTKPVALSTQRRHPLTLSIVTALGLAASASYMRTGYAGSCSSTGVNVLCSGPEDGGNDNTQSFSESGPLTVTTEAGFGLNVASGNGFNLIVTSGGTGDLTFFDNNTSSITGYSSGIYASHQGSGALSITTSGSVEGTTGRGISAYTNTNASDLTIEATADVTGGDYGIYAYHQGSGALSITTSGSVVGTTGRGISAYTNTNASDLTIEATADVTGGYYGIYAVQDGSGALSITTSGVVEGTNYYGIYAETSANASDLTIEASNNVTGGYYGIYAKHQGSGAVSITVNAAVTGGTDWGVFIRDGADGSNDNRLTIGTAAVIQGGGNGGAIRFTANNGSTDGITIVNAGRIDDNVILSANNDTFESNRDITTETMGVLNIIDSGTIDFGAGEDTFRNKGMIAGFAGALPVFTGLETFANNGEIRLKNDTVGNTLTITNNFVGEANSLLSVDANFATGDADKLEVIGDVTGTTKVNVNVLADGEQSVTVASVSGTSAASSFELADTGLYKLNISKEGNDFVVNSLGKEGVGSSETQQVGGGAKAVPVNIVSGINEIFQRAIPSYHERNEGQQLLSDDGQRRVWLRGLYNDANVENNDNDIDIAQRGLLVGGDYQLQHGRIGLYVGGHTANSSVSNGDVNSHASMTGGFVGSYYSFEGDDWYGDAAFEWQHTRIDYEGGASVGEDRFSANVLGASLEAGKTVFSDEQNTVQLFGRYQHGFSSIDDAELNNTKIEFDNSESARASAGVYWTHEVATEKTPLLLGVRGAVARDFEQDNDIQVGGITAEQRLGGTSWAELGVNVSYNLSETTLLTANVSGQLGSKRHGKGVSVGYLWTF